MSGTSRERRNLVMGAGLLLATPRVVFAASGKPRVTIKTNHGSIVVELEDKKAPITCANFLHYVDAHDYDGGIFFRASRNPDNPKEGTIVGEPNLKSHPFPPIPHEPTTKTGLKHVNGTISLGRFEPGTATSNFFICLGDQPYLDAHPGAPGDNLGFAAFGHVTEGLAVAQKILSLPTNGKTKFASQRGQWLSPPAPIFTMTRAG